MKITKQQLRRIIKEELSEEAADPNAGIYEMAKYALEVADTAKYNLRKLVYPVANSAEAKPWKDIEGRLDEVKEILHKIANLRNPSKWEQGDDDSYGGQRPRRYDSNMADTRDENYKTTT